MKTECPHCHTIFSVTEDQLSLAAGKVRCGVCEAVFLAVVQDDLFVLSAGDNSAEENSNDSDPQLLAVTDTTDAAGNDIDSNADRTTDFIDTEAAAGLSSAQQDNTEAAAEHPGSDEQPGPAPAIDPAAAESSDHADLFEGSTGYVVPQELRQQTTNKLAARLAWGLGSVLLVLLLGLQLAWSARDQLLQQPMIQHWVETACSQVDCSRLGLRAPDKMEMTSRNVYTHPTADNALMMTLTIVNRARFTQGYPHIRVEFSDVVGTTIATRVLSPDEYLALDSTTVQPLKPDSPVSFGIEIQDPGKRALTYEFSFL